MSPEVFLVHNMYVLCLLFWTCGMNLTYDSWQQHSFGEHCNQFLHSRLLILLLLMLALRLYARSCMSSSIGGSKNNMNRFDPKYKCGMYIWLTPISQCAILTARSHWDFRWWWHMDGIRIPVLFIGSWHLSVYFGCLLLLFRLHRMGVAGWPSERCRRVRYKRWLSVNPHVRNQKVSSSISSILSISIWPRNCTALTAYCSSLFLA